MMMMIDRWHRETEILDVAPIDLLHAMSKKFVATLEPFYPEGLAAQALDIEFHWVNETGKTARLTGGVSLVPTVRGSELYRTIALILRSGHLRELPTTRHRAHGSSCTT
jgi:hypothetical protein